MRYVFDHDYHIHSRLSTCSQDPAQTPERILQYAQDNNLHEIVITDHFWDENVPGASSWYKPQNFESISSVRPLPQTDKVKFLFGAEAEMDMHMTISVSKERWDAFDFVIIPTTHLHMREFTITDAQGATAQGRADAWIRRLDSLLSQDLPFHKIGIAHLACGLIAWDRETYLKTLSLLPDHTLEDLFGGCAAAGVGIEINSDDFTFAEEEKEIVLRPFQTAKAKGCKFYLGSDAHSPKGFANISNFQRAIDLLELTEDDKFRIT